MPRTTAPISSKEPRNEDQLRQAAQGRGKVVKENHEIALMVAGAVAPKLAAKAVKVAAVVKAAKQA
jgi:hypothetical protein